MRIKVNKGGKITIPKSIREKYNLTDGIEVQLRDINGSITLVPIQSCLACGRALPKELYDKHACPNCTPPIGSIIKIY